MNKKFSLKLHHFVFGFCGLYMLILVASLFMEMNLDIMSASFVALTTGYCGTSQFAAFSTSKYLPKGKMFTQNEWSLKVLLILIFVVFIEGIILQWVFQKSMALEGIFSALGLSIMAFVGGQKIKYTRIEKSSIVEEANGEPYEMSETLQETIKYDKPIRDIKGL